MLYVLYALIAGAVSAFAFEPAGLWPLLPIAFALLCEFTWRAKSMWRALLTGWAFGLGQFVVGLNWIATAFTYQAAMPAWLGWIAVVLLSLYLAIYPAMATGLAWRFGRADRVVLVTVLGGAWAVSEYLRGTMFTGFPWNPAAAAMAPTPLITITALIGTYGLSGVVVLLGGAIWLEYYKKWLPLVVIVGVTGLLWLLPSSAVPADPLAVLNIRIVQPNIGQDVKWRAGLADQAFARLSRLSAGGQSPRLLLWPEVAVPEPFALLDANRKPLPIALGAIPQALKSVQPGDVLLTGAFALIADRQGQIVGNTNSIFALDSSGRVLGRYDKAHLVPYGEYLPMRPLLSAIGLSRLAPGEGDTSYGPGPRTIDLGNQWGKVGLQICYEIIFSGNVVDEHNRPAFIFNPSNDAWFGRWGPPQHLAQARLRAAEEGLPVLRSTPTGISAVIDARGDIVKSLPWRTAGVIDAALPPAADSPPPFARLGNLIPLALGFLLIIGGIVLGRRRR